MANLVLWVKVFEAHHRVVMGAGLLVELGRVQREGDTVHLVVERLADLSPELASVGQRDAAFPLPHGRGDEGHRGGPGLDPRGTTGRPKVRDIYSPDLRTSAIQVAPRDFR